MSPAEDVKLLSELLAVIHRDGGQYQDAHGTAKAVADAMQLSSERIVEAEDAKRIGDLREAMRAMMLDQRSTGRRETYSDGFQMGLCQAIGMLDAALNGANGK